jgi:hypothetical protein
MNKSASRPFLFLLLWKKEIAADGAKTSGDELISCNLLIVSTLLVLNHSEGEVNNQRLCSFFSREQNRRCVTLMLSSSRGSSPEPTVRDPKLIAKNATTPSLSSNAKGGRRL